MLVVALALCAVIVPACDRTSPSGPATPIDQLFVLSPGQLMSIGGSSGGVQFIEVTNDSRCPINALCIAEGFATIAIAVTDDQGSSRYELRTSDPTRSSVMHRDVRIEFKELQPFRNTSRRIDPAEYRATLHVTRP